MMTRQQETAFAHPCYEAEETAHPRFRRATKVNGVLISLILTANVGLE